MENIDIWKKYIKYDILSKGTFGEVYKARNIRTNQLVAIKIIDKLKYKNQEYLKELEIIKSLKSENCLSIIETFDENDFFYIVMELCLINLEEYMNIKNEGLKEEEIKEILIQLNNILKKIKEKNLGNIRLNLSDILISLNNSKILVKLSTFGLINYLNEDSSTNAIKNILTLSPEFLENGNFSEKSDIWNLGVIIYYILFKEYPFNGKIEIQLLKDIQSNKKLKKTNDENLNDLINKMLCIDLNKRISWKEYFEHFYFKENDNQIIKNPKFNFKCKEHSNFIIYYCLSCKKNICENCLGDEHYFHITIPLYKIGLNEKENKKFQNLFKDIEINLQKFLEMNNKIKEIIEGFKNINKNENIYNEDNENNFKNYYIDYLEIIKEKIKIEDNLNIIEVKKS